MDLNNIVFMHFNDFLKLNIDLYTPAFFGLKILTIEKQIFNCISFGSIFIIQMYNLATININKVMEI